MCVVVGEELKQDTGNIDVDDEVMGPTDEEVGEEGERRVGEGTRPRDIDGAWMRAVTNTRNAEIDDEMVGPIDEEVRDEGKGMTGEGTGTRLETMTRLGKVTNVLDT